MTTQQFIDIYAPAIAKTQNRALFEVKQDLKADLHLTIKQHNKDNKSYRCLIMHKWSKWEQFKVDVPGNHGEIKQRRICLSCDKVQEEFVEFAKDK